VDRWVFMLAPITLIVLGAFGYFRGDRTVYLCPGARLAAISLDAKGAVATYECDPKPKTPPVAKSVM